MTWLGLDPVTTTEPLNTQVPRFLLHTDITGPIRRWHTHTREKTDTHTHMYARRQAQTETLSLACSWSRHIPEGLRVYAPWLTPRWF